MALMVTRIRKRVWILLVAAAASALASEATRAAPRMVREPTVIMISLDGLRLADLDDPELPTFRALIERGAVAERMQPVFPTNTFPNHVTLVTGVEPEHHGIVNNVFIDPERGLFSKANDPTWIEVEPLWSLAARHGIVSASYYWVGSQGPWRTGHGARHWKDFNSRTSEAKKVEQILAWLDLEDAAERPRLITTWFHGTDASGHREGPGSAKGRKTLRKQDVALARLVQGIEARGGFESVRLLLVSDHGMAAVERYVDLAREFRREGIRARVLGAGGVTLVVLTGGAPSYDAAAALVTRLGLAAYRPGDPKSGLRLANPRYGDLVAVAPVGTVISSGASLRGSHGYLPDEPSMGSLLIAVGDSIPAATRIGVVRALDVAPTVLTWLEIEVPDWMEGRAIPELTTAGPKTTRESSTANEAQEE